jgi:photosystem II stability/assembly factor-like uncharacterized protein
MKTSINVNRPSLGALATLRIALAFCLATALWIKAPLCHGQCSTVPRWKQIGPAPLIVDGSGPDSGHIEDIAIDPSGDSDQIIYVATAAGGIWKTLNGGSTWAPLTDGMPSVYTSAVALDPSNPSIVYAGTEGDIYHGVGIYKSLNGGDSWSILGTNSFGTNTFQGMFIKRILIPYSDLVLVASDHGLYRSIDGGQSFGANKPSFNDGRPIPIGPSGTLTSQIYVSDLKADPLNPLVVYVAVKGNGIFKSLDAGASFTTQNFLTAANGATDDLEFIYFAQSTFPNSQTMYASVALNSNGNSKKLYKADLLIDPNMGKQWREISAPGITGQADYDQTIGVDPQDANRVYVGNDDIFMATDDVNPLISIGQGVHADNHALTFSPHFNSNPTRLYVGNDGGIAYTSDAGAHWVHPDGATDCSYQNGALATIEFYQIDIGRGSTANNAYTYGACQDSGLEVGSCAGTPWHEKFGGDGYAIAVNPLDPTRAIGLGNGGVFSPGAALNGLPPMAKAKLNDNNWFYFDPNGHVAYAVANTNLYRSTDQGMNFTLMHTFPQGLTGSGVSIAMSTASSNTAWIGLSDGTVEYTTNANLGAGANWSTSISAPGPSYGPCSLAVDPGDPGTVVVAYFSPYAGPANPAVFKTTNYGTNWTDITGNLPNQILRAVIIDPNHSPHPLIVAGYAGVLTNPGFGGSWQPLAPGLPPAPAMSLAIDYSAVPSLIRVGTYGRGAWELAYDRQYVAWWNFTGFGDGTREVPFQTVRQAVNAAATGDAKVIVISGRAGGDYQETQPPLVINHCCTLMAVDGRVTIH